MTGPDKEHDMAYDIQPRASHYVAGEYIDEEQKIKEIKGEKCNYIITVET